ncbi:hypothetical protein M0Q50_09340 [bacterium]|jgi:hypothetical protein|nr:hypothetical protein [bacterium]
MKTYEQYSGIDEKEMEKLFLKVSHLDELEIVFRFIDNNYLTSSNNYLWYQYVDICYFEVNINKKYFWVNDFKIFSNIYEKINNYDDTMIFVKKMVDKYFSHKINFNIITS